jgi:hypothetical protein
LGLDAKHPSSRRASVITRRKLELGSWRAKVVSCLPMELTWTSDRLYMTISGEKLRVARFALSELASQHPSPQAIEELDSDLALPRSASFRPVHFYPPVINERYATVIIGSRHGGFTDEPMVVYVDEDKLGKWKEAKNILSDGSDYIHARTDGFIEEFDPSDDCDLILNPHKV